MIKIPKRLSCKYKVFLLFLEKTFFQRITPGIILFFFLYILLPLYLAAGIYPLLFKLLPPFYLINILVAYYLLKKNSNRKYYLLLDNQGFQEKINILNDQNSKEIEIKVSLQERTGRYQSLKEIIETINRDLNLESVANNLVSIAFSLIANRKGVCILYFVDTQNNKLNIFKTKKEDRKLVIKAKEGDIFDLWILRHASPLFIEDANKDFRFDLEKLKAQDARNIASFIGAPLISEHKFLGTMRLDSPVPNFYTQDDLRLLATICDLGAVALENSELFQKTQDLAIHDSLTSLYTKGYFLERIKEECKRSHRQKVAFSLLMLDIDHFKNCNDKFGHVAGDTVLRNLALVIMESLKGLGAVISRFGGEEFCIILPYVDKKKASSTAEDLRNKIENTKINLRGQQANVTVSVGVSTYPDDASDENDLILKVDRAMYEAKQKGRNRVVSS